MTNNLGPLEVPLSGFHPSKFVRPNLLRELATMPVSNAKSVDRFMLWIDAVGGYWVCLGDELIIGQASAAGAADIPIQADISSRHARIRRDGEGYLIDALRDVQVGGKKVDATELLADGSQIEIGRGVALKVRRPHPLSLTVRLDFASRHRTQPPADAILLLADSCVLGPKLHSHVVCRDWRREVILFRHDEKFFCHTAGYFEIDGVTCKNRGQVQLNSRVCGDGFSFSLEAVER